MSNFDWKMIRNGNAKVTRKVAGTFGLDEVIAAVVTVEDKAGNNQYSVELSPRHTLSRALRVQSEQRVSSRVENGNFFIANEKIIDFRPVGVNKQFVHSDDAISNLIEQVGVRFVEASASDDGEETTFVHQWGAHAIQPNDIKGLKALARKTKVRERLLTDEVSLSSFRDSTELQIASLGDGGQFMSAVGQIWSPFKPHIEFTMGLVRLACDNPMIGTSEGLVQRFQIVNEWDHHLSIASQRFREDLHKYINERFEAMRHNRASVDLVNKSYEHVMKRTKGLSPSHPEYDRASNLLGVLDCKFHLSNFYRDHVFKEAKLRGALQSHLTQFDLWNCVTETDAYIPPVEGSQSSTLQGFANELLTKTQKLHGVDRMQQGLATLAPFSDPDQAFFGTIAI